MQETVETPSWAPHGPCRVGLWEHEELEQRTECVAEEVPVAFVYNGISHAVMLATPQNLEDFAIGFSLSEDIVGARGDIFDIEVCETSKGISLEMHIAASRAMALRARRRTLAGRTGCGLCGIESLEQMQSRPLRVPGSSALLMPSALTRAAASLAQHQHLHGYTGAMHAAAWCRQDGEVVCVREDVGRHNALDKLIGALVVTHELLDDGFVLMTSRASYEIVCKAVSVGIGCVAALSAPTGMAVRVAESAGLTLVCFLRGLRFTVYTHPERMST